MYREGVKIKIGYKEGERRVELERNGCSIIIGDVEERPTVGRCQTLKAIREVALVTKGAYSKVGWFAHRKTV